MRSRWESAAVAAIQKHNYSQAVRMILKANRLHKLLKEYESRPDCEEAAK
jgi:hypothetical protein